MMESDRQVQMALLILIVLVITASGIVAPLWALTRPLTAYIWWIVLMAASWGQGGILMHILAPDKFIDEPELKTALTVGLGLGILSLEAFLVGLAGLFTRPALTGLVLLVLLTVVPALKLNRDTCPPRLHNPERETGLPLILVGLTVLVNLMFILAPPVFFDAMTYHLELPSRYLLEGRVFHVGENLYSGYPQLMEILYGIGLALDGLALAGLISLTVFLLTLLLLWGWGRKWFGEPGVAWGLALLALTPPFMVLVGFFHNDWAAAFFTLAVIVLILDRQRTPRRMILAGVLAGLAAGCKYNALGFAVIAPFAAGLADDLMRKDRKLSGSWGLFLVTAAAVVSPWYLKNVFFTGDPLYPLLSGLRGDVPGLGILAADTHHRILSLSDLWVWVMIPFDAVFRTWKLQFHISPGLLPVALLPTLLSLRGSRTGSRFLGIWAVLSLLAWYLSFRVGRFLLPMLAVGFLYMGAGFVRATHVGSLWSRTLKVMVSLMLLANVGSFIGFEVIYTNRTGVAFGTVSAEEYLREHYPPYLALDHLNSLDPVPEKVLFLGEMKGFYSQFPREVATFDEPNRLIEMIRKGLTADQMIRELRKAHFSHILFHPREMERLARKSPFLRLSEEENLRLREFLTMRTTMVFEARGIYVFKIHDV
jgi:hypothetical protein